jgi:hypothetical protein
VVRDQPDGPARTTLYSRHSTLQNTDSGGRLRNSLGRIGLLVDSMEACTAALCAPPSRSLVDRCHSLSRSDVDASRDQQPRLWLGADWLVPIRVGACILGA